MTGEDVMLIKSEVIRACIPSAKVAFCFVFFE